MVVAPGGLLALVWAVPARRDRGLGDMGRGRPYQAVLGSCGSPTLSYGEAAWKEPSNSTGGGGSGEDTQSCHTPRASEPSLRGLSRLWAPEWLLISAQVTVSGM